MIPHLVRRVRLAPVAIASVAFTAAAALAAPAGQDVTIPFELVNRHIVLGVSVNGSAPLSFVLDTGDKVAVIDLDRARSLALSEGREVRVGGLGSDQLRGCFLSGATFRVPGVPSLSQPVVLAVPLSGLAPKLGHDFDGILGADFIREFVVEIDYDAGRLTLHDPTRFRYRGTGEAIPIRLDGASHPLVDAAVTPDGGTPIKGTFLVDLGSGSILALHRPFASAHRLPAAAAKTIPAMGLAGAGGEGSGRVGRVAALQIGGFTLTRPMALFSADTAGAFADATIDGNIGYEILRRFRVFLDYSHGTMILEPARGFGAPFDRPSTGMTFETASHDYHVFTVTGVLEASPATEAGIKAGDVIAAIDGRPAADMTLTSVMELFERPVAREVAVRRGGAALTVHLTPRVLVD